ncbi:MAG: hypothetical protein MI864_08725, partial [Pseudomonadales bacterium]|nr:hypothetical protein [Pseudomonadales bacterium]
SGDDEDDNVNHDFASYERLDLMALANAIYAMKGEPEPPENGEDDIPANISTSAAIAVGEQIFGTLDHAGDKDWYQVYLSSDQRYRFSLEGAADNRVSGVSDPWLALHNDAGTFLVSDDDDGTGLNAQIEFTVAESGQYFLSAEAYGEETGGYHLSVTGIQNELLRDRYPDNNTTAVGVLINDGYGRNPWEAINTPGDHDWWRQILDTGYKYTINVKGASSDSGDLLDPAFRILDENGNELKRDNDSGQGADASLVFVPDEYGVYYFDVYSFNEADTGLYEVEIFVEEIENSEVPGNATTNIDLNPLFFSMKNTIDFAGDTDWYRLEMDANTAYLLTVWSSGDEDKGETPLHDPVLTIYDEHGTVLMSMDDGILNFPVLLINPDHDGTFYAEVSGFSTAETGDYLFWGGIHADDDYFDMAFPGSAVLNFGISRNGTINTVDDLDWLEVQLIAGEQYEFEVRGQSSGGGTLIDPVLHIYNGLGHPLNIHDHDLGNGLDEKISYIPKSSGTYFLVVSSEETGTYTISAESPDSIPVDDFAGGMLTEGRLNAGQQVQGSIETPFDEDWFLVSLDVGSYRIDVENAGGASGLADPAFELFDFLGVTYDIADDNSGVGLNAAKNINVSSPVSVFIGVTGSHASTGDYILSLTEI